MLDLDYLFSKYGRPDGIIHIGSQFLFARNFYLKWELFNTIWIESNPFFYDLALKSILNTNEMVFNNLISNSNNLNLKVNDTEHVISSLSLNELLSNNNIDISNYNFIHMGIQSSLESFDGLEDVLDKFKFISIEVTKNIKKASSDVRMVDKYLKSRRFKRVELNIKNGIGQAFYIKKRKYLKK